MPQRETEGDTLLRDCLFGLLAIAAFVVVVACGGFGASVFLNAGKPSPVPDTLPDIASTAGKLQEAKDLCEGRAVSARERFYGNTLSDGRDLYDEARGATNGLLKRLIVAANEGDATLEGERHGLIRDVEDKQRAFLQWFDNARFEQELNGKQETAYRTADVIAALTDGLDSAFDIVLAKDEKAANQRAALILELKALVWRSWEECGSTTGSLSGAMVPDPPQPVPVPYFTPEGSPVPP